MAANLDPYRVLGLARGAPLDDVKRAYRRLAKANHPDAAGLAALPRFLAIQQAYEALAGPTTPRPGRTAPAPPGARPRPYTADPDRADATRRAYGTRPRPGTAPGAAPGAAPGTRRKPAGSDATGPGTGGPSAARPSASARARSGASEGADSSNRTQAARGKATLGSTSYDGAEPGPFEPDWGGANWYGTTSGTYWTINPKEYADPRKHGPEYQARARRAAGARSDPGGSTTSSGEAAADADEPLPAEPAVDGAAHPGTGTDSDSIGGGPSVTDTWTSTRPRGSDAATHPARAGLAEPGSIDSIVAWLLDPRAGGTRGRISRSVLGWLPIALAIGWIVGELSGCGRFSATCDPSVGPLTAAGQAIVLGALFLIPEVAALAAGAAIVVAVAAVAATFILSATGAAADETSRRAALGALLLVAWLTGLVLALVRRVRAGPRDSPRGGRPVS